MNVHLGYFVWENPELDLLALIGIVVAVLAWRRRSRIFPLLAAGPAVYLLGTLLNGLVVALNGWHMPVAAAHVHHDVWASITSSTALPWLGDVIPIPHGLASPGDLLVWAGELAMVVAVLTLRAVPR